MDTIRRILAIAISVVGILFGLCLCFAVYRWADAQPSTRGHVKFLYERDSDPPPAVLVVQPGPSEAQHGPQYQPQLINITNTATNGATGATSNANTPPAPRVIRQTPPAPKPPASAEINICSSNLPLRPFPATRTPENRICGLLEGAVFNCTQLR